MAAAKKHPGWVGGQLLQPDGESTRRLIVGTWRSQDDRKTWHGDPRFARTRDELAALAADPEQQEWYEVVLDIRPPARAARTPGGSPTGRAKRAGGILQRSGSDPHPPAPVAVTMCSVTATGRVTELRRR